MDISYLMKCSTTNIHSNYNIITVQEVITDTKENIISSNSILKVEEPVEILDKDNTKSSFSNRRTPRIVNNRNKR